MCYGNCVLTFFRENGIIYKDVIRKYLAGHFGGKEVKKMQLSWYEKKVDEKDYMLFVHREVTQGWNSVSSLPCFHNGVEFIFGLGGSSDIYINGEIYSLKEGEVCFINSFDHIRIFINPKTNQEKCCC